MTATQHLSDIEIAAFTDGNSSTRSLAGMHEHLAACDQCRNLLIESTRLMHSSPKRSSRRSLVWKAGLPAIAALLLISLVPRLLTDRDEASGLSNAAVERRIDAGRETGIRVIQPGEGATVGPEQIRFVWARDGEASYRLTVTDATGGPVWEITTSDTTAHLPESTAIAPNSRFYWYVDALRLDGSSATSGRHSFATGLQ